MKKKTMKVLIYFIDVVLLVILLYGSFAAFGLFSHVAFKTEFENNVILFFVFLSMIWSIQSSIFLFKRVEIFFKNEKKNCNCCKRNKN